MMKPYLQQNLTVYYMHSRARRILWNLFRLLANRWRIYFTFITLSVKNPSVKSDEFLPWWQIFFTDEIFYRLIFFYRQIIFVVRSSGFKPEKKQFKKKIFFKFTCKFSFDYCDQSSSDNLLPSNNFYRRIGIFIWTVICILFLKDTLGLSTDQIFA